VAVIMRGIPILVFLALVLTSCSSDSSIPKGRIQVRNDSQDKTFNIVEVKSSGRFYSLLPGDSELLPQGASKIFFSRAYKDHVKRYIVQCPEKLESGIQIKLIDVHTGRLPGGCKTIAAYK